MKHKFLRKKLVIFYQLKQNASVKKRYIHFIQ